jgi:hypothetical protein
MSLDPDCWDIRESFRRAGHQGVDVDPLNVVCFRYRGALEDEDALNALNEKILVAIQERGIAAPCSRMR